MMTVIYVDKLTYIMYPRHIFADPMVVCQPIMLKSVINPPV